MQSTVRKPVVDPMLQKRICRSRSSPVNSYEIDVAQVLHELSNNPQSEIQEFAQGMTFIKADLLRINEAENKMVVLIEFPYLIFVNLVRKVEGRLVSELEKRLRHHVVVYGKRRILNKGNVKNFGLVRVPRNRTLSAVHDALLEDIVGSTDIVGKRTRVRVDGTKLYKIYLDPKDNTKENRDRLEGFAAVYKKLTNKNAVFSFQA